MDRVLRLVRAAAVAHDLAVGTVIVVLGAAVAVAGAIRGEVELILIGAVIAAASAVWILLDVRPGRKRG